MSEEPNGVVETKKARKVRRRSYADECQSHERAKAISEAKLATVVKILRDAMDTENAEVAGYLVKTAIGLIGEVIE